MRSASWLRFSLHHLVPLSLDIIIIIIDTRVLDSHFPAHMKEIQQLPTCEHSIEREERERLRRIMGMRSLSARRIDQSGAWHSQVPHHCLTFPSLPSVPHYPNPIQSNKQERLKSHPCERERRCWRRSMGACGCVRRRQIYKAEEKETLATPICLLFTVLPLR